MEIVEHRQVYRIVDGKPEYAYVQGVVKIDGILHSAKWTNRSEQPSSVDRLFDVEELQIHDRGPELQPEWTIAPTLECHVKSPSLMQYGSASLERTIRREIEVCELIRQHPHPYLATYYGCQVAKGRVTGICFERYRISLSDHINPGHLNKRMFLASGRDRVDKNMRESLAGVRGAVAHLYLLGIVHNDIKPANIMIDDKGSFILIDFDGCGFVGQVLTGEGAIDRRTYGWHDEEVTISTEKNDLDALAELETLLFGASEDEFMFDG